jgi:hypothetical protein
VGVDGSGARQSICGLDVLFLLQVLQLCHCESPLPVESRQALLKLGNPEFDLKI